MRFFMSKFDFSRCILNQPTHPLENMADNRRTMTDNCTSYRQADGYDGGGNYMFHDDRGDVCSDTRDGEYRVRSPIPTRFV